MKSEHKERKEKERMSSQYQSPDVGSHSEPELSLEPLKESLLVLECALPFARRGPPLGPGWRTPVERVDALRRPARSVPVVVAAGWRLRLSPGPPELLFTSGDGITSWRRVLDRLVCWAVALDVAGPCSRVRLCVELGPPVLPPSLIEGDGVCS